MLKIIQKESKMAKNETVRVRPNYLQADLDAITVLQTIGNYNPSNPAYAKTVVQEKLNALRDAQQVELNTQNALATARDATVAAEWELHNAVLGVKSQVIAQYGDSSNEIQALGLKKKSERKSPKPKKKTSA